MSNLSKGWESVDLGSLCSITTGKLNANAMVENGKYKFFTCAKEPYMINEYKFDTEALLISGNGANVGYIHYYKGKFNAYQRTYVLDKFHSDIHFIKYILQRNLKKRIDKEKNAGNTPYITLDTITEMKILLPPLEEQKKIADILSTVDKKIAFVEENINATEELKKGLMQKLLTEGIGHTEFKDSELGRIPESWEVKKLGDIGSLEGGYAFKSGEYNIEEKGYQVIRMSNINTFGLNLVKDPKYLENIEEKAKKYILNIGDILITLTGTIGKTDYGNVAFIDIDKPMVLNQRVGRFVPKKNNYNKFFFYVFNFSLFRNRFFEFGQGGTGNQANVGKNDFESIEIIVPSLEEQKQIAEILSTVDKKIENLKEKKQYFEELKKGLMQKLLTGEVRV